MEHVVHDLEVFVVVVKDRSRMAFKDQAWTMIRRARKLFFYLIKVIEVDVAIAACKNEVAYLIASLLR